MLFMTTIESIQNSSNKIMLFYKMVRFDKVPFFLVVPFYASQSQSNKQVWKLWWRERNIGVSYL